MLIVEAHVVIVDIFILLLSNVLGLFKKRSKFYRSLWLSWVLANWSLRHLLLLVLNKKCLFVCILLFPRVLFFRRWILIQIFFISAFNSWIQGILTIWNVPKCLLALRRTCFHFLDKRCWFVCCWKPASLVELVWRVCWLICVNCVSDRVFKCLLAAQLFHWSSSTKQIYNLIWLPCHMFSIFGAHLIRIIFFNP